MTFLRNVDACVMHPQIVHSPANGHTAEARYCTSCLFVRMGLLWPQGASPETTPVRAAAAAVPDGVPRPAKFVPRYGSPSRADSPARSDPWCFVCKLAAWTDRCPSVQ